MEYSFVDQYNRDDDFGDDIDDMIDDILGGKITESQREELYDSIHFILRKYSKKIANSLRFETNSNNGFEMPINYPNFNRNLPINLFLIQSQLNPFQPQAIGYSQPPNTIFSPMSTNIQPNIYQMQMFQQPQVMQPQNLYSMNQTQESKEKSKESSKKHHKSDKKDKKSKHSKSEKSDKKEKKKSKGKLKYFPYKEESRNYFDGIIKYLTKKCGGNVSMKNVVNVTASSTFSSNKPSNVVDFDNPNSYFESINNSMFNEWVKYDFKELRVKPTYYSILSGNDHGESDNPKNWVIEGSNDDISWKVLDTRNNETRLVSKKSVSEFKIQNSLGKNESFRFLRIRSTGKDTSDDYILAFSALEYFGYLYNDK